MIIEYFINKNSMNKIYLIKEFKNLYKTINEK